MAAAEKFIESGAHKVFLNDPLKFLAYIHKRVRVETNSGDVIAGFVKTIDPVSESVVLVTLDETVHRLMQVCIVMGHEVKNITIVEDSDSKTKDLIERLFMPSDSILDSKEIEVRRKSVIGWLQSNLVPLEEQGPGAPLVLLGGVVSVESPYTSQHCLSDNTIVLEKIRGLLDSVPPTNLSVVPPVEVLNNDIS